MNEGGANQQMPLVHDGIVYLTNTMNEVQALDGATGELIWANQIGPNRQDDRGSACATWPSTATDLPGHDRRPSRRPRRAHRRESVGAAVCRRGEGLLELERADRGEGQGDPGPRRLRSLSRGAVRHQRVRRRTGKPAWKFHTVAHSGEPGGDTWNNLPDMMRQGGETWIAGSYDPDVDLTFWGMAQAKPWMPVSRGTRAFDAAQHTASTVALNPDTGELVWRFQHLPGETLDLDEVYEKVAVDTGGQKALFTIGKSGILWKLNRRTGALLDFEETVFQNVYTDIDRKTGRRHLPRRHPRAEDRPVDSRLSEHRGRPQLAGDDLSPGHAGAGHPAQPVVHGDRAAQGRTGAGPGRHGRRAGGSSRCPAATATSASSPPTTSAR